MESLYVSYHKVASNWTENHHWYCQYILIISAYIPNSILLSIYICIISKVGIVCPNSFHLTYVSWNKERSNHFICPVRKTLQTELKPSLMLPLYFNLFPPFFFSFFENIFLPIFLVTIQSIFVLMNSQIVFTWCSTNLR